VGLQTPSAMFVLLLWLLLLLKVCRKMSHVRRETLPCSAAIPSSVIYNSKNNVNNNNNNNNNIT
jgi:Na+-transporting methylmalonyl-CoA/oxaloacetate decarboxylase gamma subunit